MKIRQEYQILTFHTTSAAMAMEKFAMEAGVKGRLIPVPREISAGCGLAWRMRPEETADLAPYLKQELQDGAEVWKICNGTMKIEIEEIVSLML
jgi:hypothetical protein